VDLLRAETFDRFVASNRSIEHKGAEVGGLKWLYACNYYEEDEFWRVYDKVKYEKFRREWKADRLPDLWQKVRRSRQDLKEVTLGEFVKGFVYAGLGVDKLIHK
jgi:delta24-sterol reductase